MKSIPNIVFVALTPLLITPALSQPAYPEKPIRIIVGYPPGSPSDIVARLLSQKWTETLGKPVVVDNIAGAANIPATVPHITIERSMTGYRAKTSAP